MLGENKNPDLNQPTSENQNIDSNSTTKTKPSYTEVTDRIKAISQGIKTIMPLVWLIVIAIVIIPLIGNWITASSLTTNNASNLNKPVVETVAVNYKNSEQIDREIVTAFRTASQQAETYASQQLDEWVEDLMVRVDNKFLPWYFNYFNQKGIEFKVPFQWLSSAVQHWIDTEKITPNQAVAEKLTTDFQTEFAKQVLRPQITQLQLERITRNTVNLYATELSKTFENIQASYQIPQADWERYLNDIAITVYDTEGVTSNLSLKVLAGGSTLLFAKAIAPATIKVGSAIATKLAAKSGAKMAAKTGGMVAGKVGAQLLDPIVAVGIVAWDLWDYNHTVKIDKPILRDAIYSYLQEVKFSLLENHTNSIMSAIYQVEEQALDAISMS